MTHRIDKRFPAEGTSAHSREKWTALLPRKKRAQNGCTCDLPPPIKIHAGAAGVPTAVLAAVAPCQYTSRHPPSMSARPAVAARPELVPVWPRPTLPDPHKGGVSADRDHRMIRWCAAADTSASTASPPPLMCLSALGTRPVASGVVALLPPRKLLAQTAGRFGQSALTTGVSEAEAWLSIFGRDARAPVERTRQPQSKCRSAARTVFPRPNAHNLSSQRARKPLSSRGSLLRESATAVSHNPDLAR